MTTLTVTEARALITTALDDTALSAVIAREEAEATRRCGAPGDGTTTVVEQHEVTGRNIFTRLPILSVTSVTETPEGGTAATVAANQYTVWMSDGRIKRTGAWTGLVTVTYVPQDTRPHWRQVLIELTRLAIEQTAMKAENTAGEYSYQAPEWEATRERLYRRLNYLSV